MLRSGRWRPRRHLIGRGLRSRRPRAGQRSKLPSQGDDPLDIRRSLIDPQHARIVPPRPGAELQAPPSVHGLTNDQLLDHAPWQGHAALHREDVDPVAEHDGPPRQRRRPALRAWRPRREAAPLVPTLPARRLIAAKLGEGFIEGMIDGFRTPWSCRCDRSGDGDNAQGLRVTLRHRIAPQCCARYSRAASERATSSSTWLSASARPLLPSSITIFRRPPLNSKGIFGR